MSCDSYAGSIIAKVGASFTEAQRAQLQAVYDQPGTLKPGEDREALRRSARALMLLARVDGMVPPDHLDITGKQSRVAVRLGRLGDAMDAMRRASLVPDPETARTRATAQVASLVDSYHAVAEYTGDLDARQREFVQRSEAALQWHMRVLRAADPSGDSEAAVRESLLVLPKFKTLALPTQERLLQVFADRD